VSVRSVNGPQVTHVRRSGTAFYRIFYLSHSNAVVEGFTIENGSLTGTTPDARGAGVQLYYGGTLRNCVVRGNTAMSVGGVHCYYNGVVQNCLIVSNTAQTAGGLRCDSGGTVQNCTIVGNYASSYGGGVRCYNGGQLVNTIIWSNAAPLNANYTNTGSGWSFSFCDTEPLAPGDGNLTNSPGFIDAVGQEWRLATGSPCIDKGTNQSWMTGATDLDGNPRIVGTNADIGGYEYPSCTVSGVLVAWLNEYGLAADGSADLLDADGDGANNQQEYLAGTDPTDPLSVLKIVELRQSAGTNFIRWQSAAGALPYNVWYSTNLTAGWQMATNQLPRTPPTNEWVQPLPQGDAPQYYRITITN
jgi:hypothetical protein